MDREAGGERRCLGAGLVEIVFVVKGEEVVRRVPGKVSVSMLKGLVGRMVGVEPLGVKMELVTEGEGVLMEDGGKEVGYYVEKKKGRVLVQV